MHDWDSRETRTTPTQFVRKHQQAPQGCSSCSYRSMPSDQWSSTGSLPQDDIDLTSLQRSMDSGNADDNVYDAYYDVHQYDTDLGPHLKASWLSWYKINHGSTGPDGSGSYHLAQSYPNSCLAVRWTRHLEHTTFIRNPAKEVCRRFYLCIVVQEPKQGLL